MPDGEEVFGTGDVAQWMLAQVDQQGSVGETVHGQRCGCGRGDDGRAPGDGAHPGGAVDGAAVVITVADLDLAGVDADTHPQGLAVSQRSAVIARWRLTAATTAASPRSNTQKVESPSPLLFTS